MRSGIRDESTVACGHILLDICIGDKPLCPQGRHALSYPIVIGVGALVGLLLGLGILFEPKEPFKMEIVLASTLRNVLVAMLTGMSLSAKSSALAGTGYGLVYGFAFGLVIFLAKGAFRSGSAPYVIPGATFAGGLSGLIIAVYAV